MTDELNPEQQSAAHAAMTTAEFARANIQRYLELHGAVASQYNMKIADGAAHYVMKIADPAAHYVMKIADEANAGIAKLVDDSAALAVKTLQAFIDSRKGT